MVVRFTTMKNASAFIPAGWPPILHRLCARLLRVLVAISAGRVLVVFGESCAIPSTVPVAGHHRTLPACTVSKNRLGVIECHEVSAGNASVKRCRTVRPHKRRRDVAAPIPSARPPAKSWAVLGAISRGQTMSRSLRGVTAPQRAVSALFDRFPCLD